jgi:hypothetical protein
MSLYSSIYDMAYQEQKAMLIAAHGCKMYPNIKMSFEIKRNYGNNCQEITQKILQVMTEIKSIKHVVILHLFDGFKDNNDLEDNQKVYFFEQGKKLSDEKAFYLGNSKLIQEGLDLNKKVSLLLSIPILAKTALSCEKPFSFLGENLCTTKLTKFDQYRSKYVSVIQRLKQEYPLLNVRDISKVMCNSSLCEYKNDGGSFYHDRSHLSNYGSYLTLKFLANQ